MDPQIAELVARERIIEAAELASQRGDATLASELFERACDFGRAAREALAAGLGGRALLLAVMAGDEAGAAQILDRVRASAEADRVATSLEQRGFDAWAARVLEGGPDKVRTARAWERAGNAVRAAALLEEAGDPRAAAQVLEAAIRRDPTAAGCLLALGELLVRYGKLEAAVRSLQRVPEDAPERRGALTAMIVAFERLALAQAAREAREELERRGGATDSQLELEPRGEVQRRVFGRYEVVREVASTASARVLECIDTVRGERVAVKIFSGYHVHGAGRDALARFEREVKVLGSLDHPNVVPLRDFVAEGPAIVLSWMGGGNLERMLERPIAPARAVEIACAILSALGEAHRLGILHRDVKPGNVLFDDAGVARLADFGVAHLGDLTATATAGVIGTLAYMSPEQREGRPATVRSDLYGVGAILFEMLTHRRASEGAAIRPSGVHRDLCAAHDEAVLRLVATSPEDRPPDAFTARRELLALTWPRDVEPAALPVHKERSPSARPEGSRLEVEPTGRTFDRWAGRTVERVPLAEATLARAAAFARAGHPALQTILRVGREDGTLWLEPPRGRRLDRRLSPTELAQLRQALAALHAEGSTYGGVDADHVVVGDGGPCLRFRPTPLPHASADTDFADLARLGA